MTLALTHHHHPHRCHHHHPHSSHNAPLSPSQQQFLLQLALTKTTKGSVFESNAADTAAGNAADTAAGNAADTAAGNAADTAADNAADTAADNADDAADPYKEQPPVKKKKKKRKRRKVVVPDPLEACRDCDIASCSTRISGNWCCSVAPDLPQFSSDEDDEDDNPQAVEPEEKEQEDDLPEVNHTDTHKVTVTYALISSNNTYMLYR